MNKPEWYGGVEAGGTKFNCIVARGQAEILDELRIETTTPSETNGRVIAFFAPHVEAARLRAIGVGAFGPCDLTKGSATFGYITSTPKPGWQGTDMVRPFTSALHLPVSFDTDVNAAALGEHAWGASVGTRTSLYVTIGTGIGAGLILEGRPYHGFQHPEMGHIRLPHDTQRDPFPGSCPFHGDCFEGLAGGPALRARFGQRGEDLGDTDPFWDLEAEYIGTALAVYTLMLSPEKIVLGGGIMQRSHLLPRVRSQLVLTLGGYLHNALATEAPDQFVVAPGLGSRSGALGAVALAIAQNRSDEPREAGK